MNLKNLSTAESIALVRVIGFPLILLLIYIDERDWCGWMYVILFSTDFIDGFFAFFFNQESSRRAILDTLGDILLLLAGMVGFYFFETDFFIQYLLPVSIVLGLYFLQFLLALLKWRRPTSFHTYSAKLAAIAQVIFLSFTLLFEPSVVLFYFALILSVADAVEDNILTLLMREWQANVKGLLWYRQKKENTEKEEVKNIL